MSRTKQVSQISATYDLGGGWQAVLSVNSDGNEELSVRHADKALRVDLPHESVQTLRQVCQIGA